jgi:hypothetical protein
MAEGNVNPYSVSKTSYGFMNELPNLKENNSSDSAIKVVDRFTQAQKTVDNKVKAQQDELTFNNVSVSNIQEAVLTACNLNTEQFGVVGKGSATGDAEWIGDRAAEFKGVDKADIPTARSTMYSQMDAKFDGIFGKGQYTKPTNHYEYVKLTAAATKLMNAEQKAQFKNDVEKIGQPFKTNFGLSRTQTETLVNSKSLQFQTAINTYMVGGFNGDQAAEQNRLINTFYAERDAALGRTKTK